MTQQKRLFSWHKINFLHLFLFIIYRHEYYWFIFTTNIATRKRTKTKRTYCKGSVKVIVQRTEPDRIADGIRSDCGRNLIGLRTESDWIADGVCSDCERYNTKRGVSKPQSVSLETPLFLYICILYTMYVMP